MASTKVQRLPKSDLTKASYRQQLGQIYSRREALRTAWPYSASILAYATSFTYHQGLLCYLSDGHIRLLDVHACSRNERIIDAAAIGQLTRDSPALHRSNGPSAKISLLGCTRDILVCLAAFAELGESWLTVLDVRQSGNQTMTEEVHPLGRVMLRRHLNCTKKLFVRQDGSYLYYGTHSALGSTGHHEWMIQGIDLKEHSPVTEKPLQLVEFVGSELGSTACFEIHDGTFYAVTNQTSFETEEVDWTSYYHCIQFRLDDPEPDLRPRRIWRRQHIEGPINDSWLELSLRKDERTDELLLVECRREWLNGGSTNIRTYYTQPLKMTPGDEVAVSFALPANDPLTKTLDDSSKPNYEPPKKRIRRYCHHEHPASTAAQDFILAKTKYRAYDPACQAFIDIVNDPAPRPGSVRPGDRLRLRIASRTQKSPLEPDPLKPGHHLLRPQVLDSLDEPIQSSEDDFHDTEIHVWPSDDAPTELYDILSPGGRVGQIEAIADERSIIYMTDPSPTLPGGQGALILINFDPTWRHEGLVQLNMDPFSNITPMKVGLECLSSVARGKKRSSPTPLEDDDEQTGPSKKQKFTDAHSSAALEEQQSNSRFMREEQAMYTIINRGYWLR